MKILNFRSENFFYNRPYSWLKEREESNSRKFTEAFEPLENSWGGDHTLAKNIFNKYNNELKNKFNEDWVSDYFFNEKEEVSKEYIRCLKEQGFDKQN